MYRVTQRLWSYNHHLRHGDNANRHCQYRTLNPLEPGKSVSYPWLGHASANSTELSYVSSIIESESRISEYKICEANQVIYPLPLWTRHEFTMATGYSLAEHQRAKGSKRSVRELKCALTMKCKHPSKGKSRFYSCPIINRTS